MSSSTSTWVSCRGTVLSGPVSAVETCQWPQWSRWVGLPPNDLSGSTVVRWVSRRRVRRSLRFRTVLRSLLYLSPTWVTKTQWHLLIPRGPTSRWSSTHEDRRGVVHVVRVPSVLRRSWGGPLTYDMSGGKYCSCPCPEESSVAKVSQVNR